MGSLAVLAVPLSLGLLAFAALGPAAPRAGLMAAFLAVGLAGLLYAAASHARMPAAGPSSATSLILAALVVELHADPRVAQGGAAGIAALLSLTALALSLSGLMQLLLAMSGLARLARLAPRPVLAGFMNGVSLLILLGQVPLLLGLPPGTALDASAWARASLPALGLGLFTVAVVAAVQRASVRSPAMLVALVAGTGVGLALQAIWPSLVLPRLQAQPLAWTEGAAIAGLLGPQAQGLLADHGLAILATAAVLAVIGALESLLSLAVLDELSDRRHDPSRELALIGLCNIVCGALGSLPVVLLRARAMAILRSGGRGRLASLLGTGAMLALFLFGTSLLSLLPLAVLGGIMVVIGVGLFDGHSLRQLARALRRGGDSGDLLAGAAVMLAVCVLTLWQGFAAGVTLGVLLSMVIFIGRMNRSLLRSQLTAAAVPSRRMYPPDVEARLAPLRRQIHLCELEGALFFGNGDRLLGVADQLPPDAQVLVLDLRRLGSVDETGAAALSTLGRRLASRGVSTLLSGVAAGSAVDRALQAHRLDLPRLPDADRAVEAAERHVLGPQVGDALSDVPLESSDLLRGLSAAQCQVVAAHMPVRQLAAGEAVFNQGDPADGLYVLVQGSVSVIGREGEATHRYLSFSPGMMLGETALLDGGGRSAGAVADLPARLHHLSRHSLEQLEAEHPEITSRLHRNIAVHLSSRLRAASAAWWASQR